MIRALYLSHDGMLEPLGQSQVLPYLRGLAARGARISLLSFEKPADRRDPERERLVQAALDAQGIHWIRLTYHRRPALLATAWDVAAGLAIAWRLARRNGIHVVHARSYVAGLMACLLKRASGVRFVFDMRGFWADERAEAGAWRPDGPVYRGAKRIERLLLEEADEVITLTEQARRTVASWLTGRSVRITVIPTCVNLERFAPGTGAGAPGRAPVFIYAGSVASWYLPSELFRFVRQAMGRFPGARLIVLTRERDAALSALRESGLPPDRVTIVSADPSAVPGWLAHAHAGLALYRPGFSRQGTCPTKIGEYLATGLPVVVNAGIGDVDDLIGATGVGVVLPEFSSGAYDRALDRLEQLWADPALAARCRQAAASRFSLESGIERYRAVYLRLCTPAVEAVDAELPALALERSHA